MKIMNGGKWTRSLITETFEQAYDEEELNASFLMAVAMNPDLLDPIKKPMSDGRKKSKTMGWIRQKLLFYD